MANEETDDGNDASMDFTLLLIRNIPQEFRAADVRSYFASFVESKGVLCFHYRHRPEAKKLKGVQHVGSVDDQTVVNSKDKYCCCIVKLTPSTVTTFLSMYSDKQWCCRRGQNTEAVCVISEMRKNNGILSVSDKHGKNEDIKSNSSSLSAIFSHLPELNPPIVMPQGNVGTKTSTFFNLIRNCQLPTYIIKRLGLQFPMSSVKRIYSNVPYDYSHTQRFSCSLKCNRKIRRTSQMKWMKYSSPKVIPKKESGLFDESDECEDWERYESLHSDITQQQRSKERLYEDNIELQWEKGGSGLVFYTDAQFWDAQDGDFDEKTADDWDIDLSVYEENGGGDKDAKDLLAILRERKLNYGMEKTVPFYNTDCLEIESMNYKIVANHHLSRKICKDYQKSSDRNIKRKMDRMQNIGKFEQHTKGIGRKIMEKYGWKTGDGLGNSTVGIAEALENDGQSPYDKKGLGYYGEKLNNFAISQKRQIDEPKIIITTIYDKL